MLRRDEDGLHRGWVKDGRTLRKLVHQPEAQVQAVLDFTQECRNRDRMTGSENMKFLANVPLAMVGQWTHDWRQKGGHNGTGMSAQEYILLKASLPDYSSLVSTPSGKTGFEKKARQLRYGWRKGLDLKRVQPKPAPGRLIT